MKIKIKPVEGKIVRNPVTRQPLSKDGELVEKSPFWIRRLKDGDVVHVNEPASKKTGDK